MKDIRFSVDGKSYQVPEKYAEMNERQFRAAVMRLMRFSDRDCFWESFAGIPRRLSGCLPEWVHLELSSIVEYITQMEEEVDHFIIQRLPLLGTLRPSRLYAPSPMLGNVSLQQFMSADNFFSFYTVTQRESFIDLLCASLYLKENETFVLENKHDKLVPMEEREKYFHRHVPTEVRFGIFINWIFIKNWLTTLFPNLFQRGKGDGKPHANDWLPLFDSFVGDNIPFMREYQRMPCMDAFRIIDAKIKKQNER